MREPRKQEGKSEWRRLIGENDILTKKYRVRGFGLDVTGGVRKLGRSQKKRGSKRKKWSRRRRHQGPHVYADAMSSMGGICSYCITRLGTIPSSGLSFLES
ncbi:hypothetical protein VNO77_02614 [Canavalia gladiata]|uniref:Uncharacterized protein n=1 Tax=Canavalia gladiata TaxID=3824 RepID=A0AAN9MYJ8_CANGL